MKRSFFIGEEWLYYKIYCGERTADHLLVETIKPLTASLRSKELIDKWFFIRYTDPHFHLRIRFHLNNVLNLGNIIKEIQQIISPYFEQDLLWKVQTSTYQRELERYGKTTMGEAEDLFYIDSKTCIAALNLIEEDELLFFFVLRSIDQLLTVFKRSTEEKIIFSKHNLDAFKQEFRSDKNTNKQLLKKYKKIEKAGTTFLSLAEHEKYAPLLQLLNEKEKALQAIALKILQRERTNQLEVPLTDLLSSYIHMMVNRSFRNKQRLYELLCYHFLSAYYSKKKYKI